METSARSMGKPEMESTTVPAMRNCCCAGAESGQAARARARIAKSETRRSTDYSSTATRSRVRLDDCEGEREIVDPAEEIFLSEAVLAKSTPDRLSTAAMR